MIKCWAVLKGEFNDSDRKLSGSKVDIKEGQINSTTYLKSIIKFVGF